MTNHSIKHSPRLTRMNKVQMGLCSCFCWRQQIGHAAQADAQSGQVVERGRGGWR